MNKRQYRIIILIGLCILVIFFLRFDNSISKKNDAIESYHRTMISYAKDHIASANNLMNGYDSESHNPLVLRGIYSNLESASEYISHFSIYYTYKSEDSSYRGNLYASVFFKSYSKTAKDWAAWIMNNDESKIPTENEILKYKSDIERIAEAFEVYSSVDYKHDITMEEIDYEELKELIIDLSKKSECETVKDNMGYPLREYLKIDS